MRGLKMLAVCSALVAGAASAQETAAAADVDGARWSVGAGAGITVAGNNENNPRDFVPRASVEYLLTSDTALVLGAFGGFGVEWAGGGGSEVGGGLGGTLGVRKYLAGAGPNRLSIHGLFNLGWNDAENEASSLEAGIGGGFAVDHQLSEGLILRAGVDLANFGFDRNAGENRVGLDFFLAPSVELRFTF